MTSRVLIAAVSAFLAVQLLAWVGLGLCEHELERLRDQHFRNVISELREQLQTDLNIGLELADSPRSQALLEDGVARIPQLLALEILSDSGVSLFSSDRGLRGLPAPEQWLEALRASPDGWQTTRQDERSLGVPLYDATGHIAGYLVLTYRLNGNTDASAPSVAWVAWPVAALTALLSFMRERRIRARMRDELQRLRESQPAPGNHRATMAAWHVTQARATLAEADARARTIAETEA